MLINRCVRFGLGVGFSFLLADPAVGQPLQVLSAGIESLATQITESVGQDGERKVAVLPFRDQRGGQTILGSYVADEVTTRLLMQGRIALVERDPANLERLISEMEKGQYSGYFDPSTVQEIGRLTGANTIVTGTVTDLQSFVAVNARLVDTGTGSMFGAALVKIVRDDDVKKILGVPLLGERANTGLQEAAPDVAPSKGSTLRAQRVERANGLELRLQKCEIVGGPVRCQFLITSLGGDASVGVDGGRIIDLAGEETSSSRIVFGEKDDSFSIRGTGVRVRGYSRNNMAAGIPVKLEVTFRTSTLEGGLALLELSLNTDRAGTFLLRFRDVSVKH